MLIFPMHTTKCSQVRTRLYELIAHCIPPEVIFVGIQKELVKVVNHTQLLANHDLTFVLWYNPAICHFCIRYSIFNLSRCVMVSWRLNFAKLPPSTSTGCRRGTRPYTTWRPSSPSSWPSTWSLWRTPVEDSRRRVDEVLIKQIQLFWH